MNFIFPYIGNFIIPTDELIFFRGVGIPPTSQKVAWKKFCLKIREAHPNSDVIYGVPPLNSPGWREIRGFMDQSWRPKIRNSFCPTSLEPSRRGPAIIVRLIWAIFVHHAIKFNSVCPKVVPKSNGLSRDFPHCNCHKSLLNPPFWTNPSWFIALLQFYRSWINFWLPIVSNLGWKIYWWMVNSDRTLGLWCGFLVRRTDCWWSCRCCQWPQHGGKP